MSDHIFRLRVGYAKQGRLRHLGHLEMLRTIERCVRRAGLPFAVTQGFSPHMRVQFSSALPTGVSSTCECYDVFLTSLVDPQEAHAALVASTPPDIAPFAVAYAPRELPALESWLTRARWEVRIDDGGAIGPGGLSDALAALVEVGGFDYLRGTKTKHVDLGEKLVSYEVGGRGGHIEATIETRSDATGALRPSALVTAALGMTDAANAVPLVTRVGQWHEDEDGSLVSPFRDGVPWPA